MWRDLRARYKGNFLGPLWALLTPLVFLFIYTFVFTRIFDMNWKMAANDSGVIGGFPAWLFVGLLTHGMFADALIRSPSLFFEHSQFIKKVVFPFGVLPVMISVTALVNFTIGFAVLSIFMFVSNGSLSWVITLSPVIFFPLFLYAVGLSFLVSSASVLIRDIAQVMGMGITALLFLSPVFYPASAIPSSVKAVAFCNPLTFAITSLRGLLFEGVFPDFWSVLIYWVFAIVVLIVGWWFFISVKHTFADHI